MRQALYRKYRSKSFDELVGQEHIVQTLRSAISKDQISHAYLFSGPRGVGKTSAARLLAYGINELPYKSEETHLDIIEIDAASNRRIDEIRDIREKVHILPTSAKYKVYIIDEAHMLTKEAFNALLKTLEEPPNHCVFILATTDFHKLPETIVSRTQNFIFHPASSQKISEHLLTIANLENIKIDESALELIAQHGRGSFRDSIGMLDQLSGLNRAIGLDDVKLLLGIPSQEIVVNILDAVSSGNAMQIVEQVSLARQNGYNASVLASSLSAYLRTNLLKGSKASWVIPLLKDLLLVPGSPMPYDQLELSLIDATIYSTQADTAKNDTTSRAALAEPVSISEPVTKSSSVRKESLGKFSLDDWPELVTKVKEQAASLYTALRLAEPKFEHGVLLLNFNFPLHQKKINDPKSKRLIGNLIEKLFGSKVEIQCVVDKSLTPTPTSNTSRVQQPEFSQTISNIFGTTEVLES